MVDFCGCSNYNLIVFNDCATNKGVFAMRRGRHNLFGSPERENNPGDVPGAPQKRAREEQQRVPADQARQMQQRFLRNMNQANYEHLIGAPKKPRVFQQVDRDRARPARLDFDDIADDQNVDPDNGPRLNNY